MPYEIDDSIKASLIHMLHTLALQDGVLHRNEMKFIYGVLDEFGLDIEILDEIPDDFNLNQITLPDTDVARMEILYRLLFLMRFDNKVSKSEISFIRHLTLKLGVQPMLTAQLSQIMKEHENKPLPNEQLLSAVKKHLN